MKSCIPGVHPFGPDVIFFSQHTSGGQGLLLKYARRAGMPFVFRVQDLYGIGATAALRGCASLLSRFARVYRECSFIELYAGQALAVGVVAWLRERSFKLCGVYNMAYDRDGKAVQADFLFKRQSAACAS